jgi:putative membrane protein insertion efficiency factor
MRWFLISIIRFYSRFISPVFQAILSPMLGNAGCRFTPTCSQYAVEAIKEYGAWRGSVMAIKRIGRCHPWRKGGFDPVPKK